MKHLQVLENKEWKYVFAYSSNIPGKIITTSRKSVALSGKDLFYFRNKFGNHTFRLAN